MDEDKRRSKSDTIREIIKIIKYFSINGEDLREFKETFLNWSASFVSEWTSCNFIEEAALQCMRSSVFIQFMVTFILSHSLLEYCRGVLFHDPNFSYLLLGFSLYSILLLQQVCSMLWVVYFSRPSKYLSQVYKDLQQACSVSRILSHRLKILQQTFSLDARHDEEFSFIAFDFNETKRTKFSTAFISKISLYNSKGIFLGMFVFTICAFCEFEAFYILLSGSAGLVIFSAIEKIVFSLIFSKKMAEKRENMSKNTQKFLSWFNEKCECNLMLQKRNIKTNIMSAIPFKNFTISPSFHYVSLITLIILCENHFHSGLLEEELEIVVSAVVYDFYCFLRNPSLPSLNRELLLNQISKTKPSINNETQNETESVGEKDNSEVTAVNIDCFEVDSLCERELEITDLSFTDIFCTDTEDHRITNENNSYLIKPSVSATDDTNAEMKFKSMDCRLDLKELDFPDGSSIYKLPTRLVMDTKNLSSNHDQETMPSFSGAGNGCFETEKRKNLDIESDRDTELSTTNNNKTSEKSLNVNWNSCDENEVIDEPPNYGKTDKVSFKEISGNNRNLQAEFQIMTTNETTDCKLDDTCNTIVDLSTGFRDQDFKGGENNDINTNVSSTLINYDCNSEEELAEILSSKLEVEKSFSAHSFEYCISRELFNGAADFTSVLQKNEAQNIVAMSLNPNDEISDISRTSEQVEEKSKLSALKKYYSTSLSSININPLEYEVLKANTEKGKSLDLNRKGSDHNKITLADYDYLNLEIKTTKDDFNVPHGFKKVKKNDPGCNLLLQSNTQEANFSTALSSYEKETMLINTDDLSFLISTGIPINAPVPLRTYDIENKSLHSIVVDTSSRPKSAIIEDNNLNVPKLSSTSESTVRKRKEKEEAGVPLSPKIEPYSANSLRLQAHNIENIFSDSISKMVPIVKDNIQNVTEQKTSSSHDITMKNEKGKMFSPLSPSNEINNSPIDENISEEITGMINEIKHSDSLGEDTAQNSIKHHRILSKQLNKALLSDENVKSSFNELCAETEFEVKGRHIIRRGKLYRNLQERRQMKEKEDFKDYLKSPPKTLIENSNNIQEGSSCSDLVETNASQKDLAANNKIKNHTGQNLSATNGGTVKKEKENMFSTPSTQNEISQTIMNINISEEKQKSLSSIDANAFENEKKENTEKRKSLPLNEKGSDQNESTLADSDHLQLQIKTIEDNCDVSHRFEKVKKNDHGCNVLPLPNTKEENFSKLFPFYENETVLTNAESPSFSSSTEQPANTAVTLRTYDIQNESTQDLVVNTSSRKEGPIIEDNHLNVPKVPRSNESVVRKEKETKDDEIVPLFSKIGPHSTNSLHLQAHNLENETSYSIALEASSPEKVLIITDNIQNETEKKISSSHDSIIKKEKEKMFCPQSPAKDCVYDFQIDENISKEIAGSVNEMKYSDSFASDKTQNSFNHQSKQTNTTVLSDENMKSTFNDLPEGPESEIKGRSIIRRSKQYRKRHEKRQMKDKEDFKDNSKSPEKILVDNSNKIQEKTPCRVLVTTDVFKNDLVTNNKIKNHTEQNLSTTNGSTMEKERENMFSTRSTQNEIPHSIINVNMNEEECDVGRVGQKNYPNFSKKDSPRKHPNDQNKEKINAVLSEEISKCELNVLPTCDKFEMRSRCTFRRGKRQLNRKSNGNRRSDKKGREKKLYNLEKIMLESEEQDQITEYKSHSSGEPYMDTNNFSDCDTPTGSAHPLVSTFDLPDTDSNKTFYQNIYLQSIRNNLLNEHDGMNQRIDRLERSVFGTYEEDSKIDFVSGTFTNSINKKEKLDKSANSIEDKNNLLELDMNESKLKTQTEGPMDNDILDNKSKLEVGVDQSPPSSSNFQADIYESKFNESALSFRSFTNEVNADNTCTDVNQSSQKTFQTVPIQNGNQNHVT